MRGCRFYRTLQFFIHYFQRRAEYIEASATITGEITVDELAVSCRAFGDGHGPTSGCVRNLQLKVSCTLILFSFLSPFWLWCQRAME